MSKDHKNLTTIVIYPFGVLQNNPFNTCVMSNTEFLDSGFLDCLFLQRSRLFFSDVTGVNLHVKGHPLNRQKKL